MKKDIKNIPFELIATKYAPDELDRFLETYNIPTSWEWLGPQLIAHLATYTLPATACVDSLEFLKLNVGKDAREVGIYRMLMLVNRSKLIKSKQTSPAALPYCSLVPLYLAAQKQYNNVPYSRWSPETIQHIVPSDLHLAMVAELPQLTSAELLKIRQTGLRGKNPQTYNNLHDTKGTVLDKLPRLAKVMVTQIWCAHPANRHQYMVLDPSNWDNMPEPLIGDPLQEVESPQQSVGLDLPWFKNELHTRNN